MIRCFLAINLSTEAERFLSRSIEELRGLYRKKVKWVRPENCHLTLKFLGNVEEGTINDVESKVRQISSTYSPFEITLGGTGVFPNPRFPKVLWFGLKGELASLRQLHRDIEQGLTCFGFEPDNRPFMPHVTVGRVKSRSWKTSELEKFLKIDPPPLEMAIEKIHLYQSILHPGGPEYRSLASFPLIKKR